MAIDRVARYLVAHQPQCVPSLLHLQSPSNIVCNKHIVEPFERQPLGGNKSLLLIF